MLLGYGIKVFHNLTSKCHHLDALYLHFHLLVLNLPEIQYLINQAQHTVCISLYNLQLFTGILRQLRIVQHILHRAGYQGQRSTQFMRNVRKEAQFHVCHLLFHGHLMLQTIDCEQNIDSRHNNQHHKQHIQEIGKRSFPKRRKYLYIKQTSIFRPHTLGIGRTNLKHIMSFGQVGIGSHPLLADVIP